MKRGLLNKLVLPCKENNYRPPVASSNIRHPGSRKGKRFVFLEGVYGKQMGLLTYIRANAETFGPAAESTVASDPENKETA